MEADRPTCLLDLAVFHHHLVVEDVGDPLRKTSQTAHHYIMAEISLCLLYSCVTGCPYCSLYFTSFFCCCHDSVVQIQAMHCCHLVIFSPNPSFTNFVTYELLYNIIHVELLLIGTFLNLSSLCSWPFLLFIHLWWRTTICSA
jgi:hypothetical protein